ncbi:hypothetical protein ACFHWW_27230 [Ensifer sp. P24N7]|uniref:hypothetical protein n=1 Tax=Sinorhizobium sp. P24N7 TaxID=3348358 RepID=UPI0035F3C320
MTAANEDPHALLCALEAQGANHDALTHQLIAHLRDMVEAREDLERLTRMQTIGRAARTALIAEAAALLVEHGEAGEVVTLARYRRPKLRLVQ